MFNRKSSEKPTRYSTKGMDVVSEEWAGGALEQQTSFGPNIVERCHGKGGGSGNQAGAKLKEGLIVDEKKDLA